MRISIRHETRYRYDQPVRQLMQVLRLTPRNHEGQHVAWWRIDVDAECRLRAAEDAFGNLVHSFSLDQPLEALGVVASGEVECSDTSGVARGTVERFPPELFLRDTPLTTADQALRTFARDQMPAEADKLAQLHALMQALGSHLVFEAGPTTVTTSASEAFGLSRGVCQDFAHMFIACARHVGIPARYVAGYLLRDAQDGSEPAGHAWAEAAVPGLGWVGFDAANRQCPDERYVRVAAALDSAGAAPVRGSRAGSASEILDVRVAVHDMAGEGGQQRQRQLQGATRDERTGNGAA